jgi:hypothetical protein
MNFYDFKNIACFNLHPIYKHCCIVYKLDHDFFANFFSFFYLLVKLLWYQNFIHLIQLITHIEKNLKPLHHINWMI